jgi:hypothetical protein
MTDSIHAVFWAPKMKKKNFSFPLHNDTKCSVVCGWRTAFSQVLLITCTAMRYIVHYALLALIVYTWWYADPFFRWMSVHFTIFTIHSQLSFNPNMQSCKDVYRHRSNLCYRLGSDPTCALAAINPGRFGPPDGVLSPSLPVRVSGLTSCTARQSMVLDNRWNWLNWPLAACDHKCRLPRSPLLVSPPPTSSSDSWVSLRAVPIQRYEYIQR